MIVIIVAIADISDGGIDPSITLWLMCFGEIEHFLILQLQQLWVISYTHFLLLVGRLIKVWSSSF